LAIVSGNNEGEWCRPTFEDYKGKYAKESFLDLR
jgi:hypothetical protein